MSKMSAMFDYIILVQYLASAIEQWSWFCADRVAILNGLSSSPLDLNWGKIKLKCSWVVEFEFLKCHDCK